MRYQHRATAAPATPAALSQRIFPSLSVAQVGLKCRIAAAEATNVPMRALRVVSRVLVDAKEAKVGDACAGGGWDSEPPMAALAAALVCAIYWLSLIHISEPTRPY